MTVSLTQWLVLHAALALFWIWILCLGGARVIEGWKAWGLIGWFAGHWNEAQLRLYALVLLVGQVIWFTLGLVDPAWRFWV